MKKIISLIILICFSFLKVLSQTDTLINYDCQSKIVTTVLPPQTTNTKDFEYTNWNFGQDNNTLTFYPENPVDNSISYNITELHAVQSSFNLYDFPARSVVKILRYEEGILKSELGCSGIMVSKDLVITAGHCLFDYPNNFLIDSLLIIPAYNNDLSDPTYGSSTSTAYYLLKRFYEINDLPNGDAFFKECFSTDIGLIRLKEELGANTGWVGIAHSDSLDFYEENVFHQFSYPNQSPYSGYELYYAKGKLNVFDDELFGNFIGNYGQAKFGQSGSSLLYSDNSKYYSIGTLKGYNDLLGQNVTFHVRITKDIFNAFKPVIENGSSTIVQDISIPRPTLELKNYPNPFNNSTTICFNLKKREHVLISIYNVFGMEITVLADSFFPAGENHLLWETQNLSKGIYFARLKTSSEIRKTKMVLQK